MMANPKMSLAHRPSVEDSWFMVLLKLMYLKIYKDEKKAHILWRDTKAKYHKPYVGLKGVSSLPWSMRKTG